MPTLSPLSYWGVMGSVWEVPWPLMATPRPGSRLTSGGSGTGVGPGLGFWAQATTASTRSGATRRSIGLHPTGLTPAPQESNLGIESYCFDATRVHRRRPLADLAPGRSGPDHRHHRLASDYR